MKPSIAASLSTDSFAPGGGSNGTPSANAAEQRKTRPSSPNKVRRARVIPIAKRLQRYVASETAMPDRHCERCGLIQTCCDQSSEDEITSLLCLGDRIWLARVGTFRSRIRI